MQSIMASTLRMLSNTSRMHIMVVQGDPVFDVLCSLEPSDSRRMQQAKLLCETNTGKILIPIPWARYHSNMSVWRVRIYPRGFRMAIDSLGKIIYVLRWETSRGENRGHRQPKARRRDYPDCRRMRSFRESQLLFVFCQDL